MPVAGDDPRMVEIMRRREAGKDGRPEYRGVVPRPDGLFDATIERDGKVEKIGTYADPKDAARMHDRRMFGMTGDRSGLNFPEAFPAPKEQETAVPHLAEKQDRNIASEPGPTVVEPLPKSKYRGVNWHGSTRKWRVVVCTPNGIKHAGCYPREQEIEAARAYDRTARILLGDKAKLNFPDIPPAVVPVPKKQEESRAMQPRTEPIVGPTTSPTPTSLPRDPVTPPPKSEAGPGMDRPGIDREVRAIGAVVEALGGLDAAARKRVLAWAAARYGATAEA